MTATGDPMRRSGADCCERYFYLKKVGRSTASRDSVSCESDQQSACSSETPTLRRSRKVDTEQMRQEIDEIHSFPKEPSTKRSKRHA